MNMYFCGTSNVFHFVTCVLVAVSVLMVVDKLPKTGGRAVEITAWLLAMMIAFANFIAGGRGSEWVLYPDIPILLWAASRWQTSNWLGTILRTTYSILLLFVLIAVLHARHVL